MPEHIWSYVPTDGDAQTGHNPMSAASAPSHVSSSPIQTDKPSQRQEQIKAILAPNKHVLIYPQLLLHPSAIDAAVEETSWDVPELIQACREQFVAHAPFLRNLSVQAFEYTQEINYVTLSMMCIGVATSSGIPEKKRKADALWHRATKGLAGQLEIDNREARNPRLIKAWLLLVTYAALSSNSSIWRKANFAQGHVETTLQRIVVESPGDMQSGHGMLVAYFLTIDLIRALHYGQSTALAASNGPLSTCSLIPLAKQEDRCFLELVSILARAHTLSTIYSPALRPESRRTDLEAPYLAFSSQYQLAQMTKRIESNLDEWRRKIPSEVFFSSDNGLAAMYHLCWIVLRLPTLQYLPMLAGYAPRIRSAADRHEERRASAREAVRQGLISDRESIQHAERIWSILGQQLQGSSVPRAMTQAWTPIALFYAMLVLWASKTCRMIFSQESEDPGSIVDMLSMAQEWLRKADEYACEGMEELFEQLKTKHFDPE